MHSAETTNADLDQDQDTCGVVLDRIRKSGIVANVFSETCMNNPFFGLNTLYAEKDLPCGDGYAVKLKIGFDALLTLYATPIDPQATGLALVHAFVRRGAEQIGQVYRHGSYADLTPFNFDDYIHNMQVRWAEDGYCTEMNLHMDVPALFAATNDFHIRELQDHNLLIDALKACGGFIQDYLDGNGAVKPAVIQKSLRSGLVVAEAHCWKGMPANDGTGLCMKVYDETTGLIAAASRKAEDGYIYPLAPEEIDAYRRQFVFRREDGCETVIGQPSLVMT